MAYRRVVAQLDQFRSFGINLGLARITDMLRIFDNPENKFPLIHIGGTNGKGSTLAMLAAILQEAGYRVGVFSSPHLLTHRERFVINGEMIEELLFVSLFEQVRDILPQVQKDTGEMPTEFEILTAMAFLYFAQEKVDLALIEVGLGGDIDSTNVVQHPLLSIITNISFDHQDRLGTTLREITEKKCGIIKAGCPVVTASRGEDVLRMVRQRADNLEAPLVEIHRSAVWEGEGDAELGQYFTVRTKRHNYGRIFLPLRGEHQLENAVTAILSMEILEKQGYRFSRKIIRTGLAKTSWAGRLELMGHHPLFVLDGAHNPAGFQALAQWLAKKREEVRRVILVIGMLDDKEQDWAACLLQPLVEVVIITRPNSERTVNWLNLQNYFCKEIPLFCREDLAEAIQKAQEEAENGDLILITGSLHLVGKARTILKEQIA